MRKIILSFIVIICFAISASARTSFIDSSFTLKGMFTGIADGTEVKLENANDNKLIGSAKFLKGAFVIHGKLAEPTLCWFKVAGEASMYLYIESGTINITGSKPVAKNFKVTGSSAHTDFSEFQGIFNPLIVRLQAIVPAINSAYDVKARDSLMNIYNKIIDTVQLQIDVFVERHPVSYVTPFILFVTAQFYEDILLLEKRFYKVGPVVRSSPMSQSLKQYIDVNKIGAVGTPALDFTQPDTTGTPVTLSSFKGKYVLVDFWASWCGPCRMENPNVVENFNKFKDKNFTVLGVSLDRPGKKNDWINAIHKDNLTWTHVSDLQYWNNAAAKLYNVSGIPFNFLIDPEGRIIGRNLRGPDLGSKLCEILGCN